MKSTWFPWIFMIFIAAALAFQLGRVIASHYQGPHLEDTAGSTSWSEMWWRQ